MIIFFCNTSSSVVDIPYHLDILIIMFIINCALLENRKNDICITVLKQKAGQIASYLFGKCKEKLKSQTLGDTDELKNTSR